MNGASSKRKGSRAELEVQAIFQDQLGVGRRALGAGRKDDIGDIHGIPNLTVQVANRTLITEVVRHKPEEAERQRLNAGNDFACTFLRLYGGDYRVVMTVPQFMAIYREAMA